MKLKNSIHTRQNLFFRNVPQVPNKHLLILGIRGIPATHGGFESFVERLGPWMVQQGWKVTVYCQGSITGKRYEDSWGGCRRIHIPVSGDGPLATIIFDLKSTRDAMREAGIFLTLGYNTGFLAAYVRLKGRFNLINMDGIEWKRAKYSVPAKIYLWINERIAALAGNILIADHPEIANHHANHAPRKKIVTIAYGSDRIVDADPKLLDEYGLEPNQFFTVIARPEPENSVLEIVRSFSSQSRGMKLVVLGSYRCSHAYQKSVLQAASDEVVFLGPVYDKTKLSTLRRFSVAYIHGHQVGGTNPSLVEALGSGNAIIAHDNQFNRWVAEDAGIYFSDEEQLQLCLQKLVQTHELRALLQTKSTERWSTEFQWENILLKYYLLFERCL